VNTLQNTTQKMYTEALNFSCFFSRPVICSVVEEFFQLSEIALSRYRRVL